MIFLFLSHSNLFRFIPGKLSCLMLLQKSKSLLILFSIVAVFMFSNCDKIPNNVVDSKIVDYAVDRIETPSSVSYSKVDSSVTTSIWLANNESVNIVWCKISSVDGRIIINSRLILQYAYDMVSYSWQRDLKVYSAKFPMSRLNPNGKYQIEYFVEDNVNLPPNNSAKVGSALFTFDNNQNNLPPVISDLVIPGSVNRGESFIFTLKVDDPNGLSDIYQVYFKLFRPDGSQVLGAPGQDYILMYDNGDQNFGDQNAGDGIYSFKNSFSSTSQTGTWRFEFQAKDRGGNLSNVLLHNMIVN